MKIVALAVALFFTILGGSAAADELHYFVQAGAFAVEQEALSQAARLKANNLPAIVSTREQSGRAVYRVRIGPFRDKAVSEAVIRRLEALAIEGVLVRVEGKLDTNAAMDNKLGQAPHAGKPTATNDPPQVARGKCNALTQYAAASPVPSGAKGDWWVYNQKNQSTMNAGAIEAYKGPGETPQDQIAGVLKARCDAQMGSPCIHIGGCTNTTWSAAAVAKDGSWAWVGCGGTPQEAGAAAVRLCELKMGCECIQVGGGRSGP